MKALFYPLFIFTLIMISSIAQIWLLLTGRAKGILLWFQARIVEVLMSNTKHDRYMFRRVYVYQLISEAHNDECFFICLQAIKQFLEYYPAEKSVAKRMRKALDQKRMQVWFNSPKVNGLVVI